MSEQFRPDLKRMQAEALESAQRWAGKEFYVVDKAGEITRHRFGNFTGQDRLEVLRWYDADQQKSAGYYHMSEFRKIGEAEEFLDEAQAREIAERRKENIEKILKPLVGKTLYTLDSQGNATRSRVESDFGIVDETGMQTGESLYLDPENNEVRLNRYVSIPDETGQEDDNTYEAHELDHWTEADAYHLGEDDDIVSEPFQVFYTFDPVKLQREQGKLKVAMETSQ